MKENELRDIVISALVLALAFGIVFSGGIAVLSEPRELVDAFALSLVGVSSGFILHEMGHRYLARRYNCEARYVMWPSGLWLALLMSLAGFIIAAPGAVMIRPKPDMWGRVTLTKQRYGLISIAGPVMNVSLALIFLLLYTVHPAEVFSLGARVNTWLAFFNLIPFGPLDGKKIMLWNKTVWGVAIAVVGGMFIAQLFIL